MTYMSIDEFGGDVRLWVLVLDGVVPFVLVFAQCLCDIIKGGGLDIIQVVGEEDCILHRVYCAGTTAWKELKKKKKEKGARLEGCARAIALMRSSNNSRYPYFMCS